MPIPHEGKTLNLIFCVSLNMLRTDLKSFKMVLKKALISYTVIEKYLAKAFLSFSSYAFKSKCLSFDSTPHEEIFFLLVEGFTEILGR